MSKLNILVLGINEFLNTALITTHGCTYGCPAKFVDGEWFFKFLNKWYSVAEYAGESTTIVSDLGNGLVSRKFK